MSPEMLELLLADTTLRPQGGWSAKAEEWTEARMSASWYTTYDLAKTQRKLAKATAELEGERQEVVDLTAEVEVLRRKQPDL
jgi:hypothetical protein